MTIPKRVRIVEVGPRDGLQNEKKTVGTNTKIQLISQLASAGLTNIEAGSFVSPKWVPQMASSGEVFNIISNTLQTAYPKIIFSALTPNEIGVDRAIEHRLKKLPYLQPHQKALAKKISTALLKKALNGFIRSWQKLKVTIFAYAAMYPVSLAVPTKATLTLCL